MSRLFIRRALKRCCYGTIEGWVLGPRRARQLRLLPPAQGWRRRGLSLREIAATLGGSVWTADRWTAAIPRGDISQMRHKEEAAPARAAQRSNMCSQSDRRGFRQARREQRRGRRPRLLDRPPPIEGVAHHNLGYQPQMIAREGIHRAAPYGRASSQSQPDDGAWTTQRQALEPAVAPSKDGQRPAWADVQQFLRFWLGDDLRSDDAGVFVRLETDRQVEDLWGIHG